MGETSMKQYILAHDLGTTGNKATLFETNGELVSSMVYEYETFYQKENWVEQNPEDWWNAVCKTTKKLLKKENINKENVAVISFSAQMMGCLLVDQKGNALRNMIIWADTRANKQEKEMEKHVGMRRAYQITGHRISASYSAAKLLWIRENERDIYNKAYKMLNAKDFIICRLTGKFVTDYSDASGTNLFDIKEKKWSKEILRKLNIPLELMPDVYPSTYIAGGVQSEVAKKIGLKEGTPVVIGGGDGSCACVGAGVIKPGTAYNVLGSSSWMSAASKTPLFDEEMRTFNWVHLDPKLYTPCGTMQAAGYSYSWYKNTLCEMETELAKKIGSTSYEMINKGAEKSNPGANKVLYLPYLLGERSPRWNSNARGAFIGMGITTNKNDMSRAILEGVGYNLRVILETLNDKLKITEITIIGGGAKGEIWLQILSDIWQKELVVSEYPEEATSMGAAVCAGVGIGLYKDFSAVSMFNTVSKRIKPNKENYKTYNKMYHIFNQAYESLIKVYNNMADIDKTI